MPGLRNDATNFRSAFSMFTTEMFNPPRNVETQQILWGIPIGIGIEGRNLLRHQTNLGGTFSTSR